MKNDELQELNDKLNADLMEAQAEIERLRNAAPATAPKPVGWINGHDLRLLGRQGRSALVWCDNEGNSDTPLYLHPSATAPSWQDAPTCAGVWLSAEPNGTYDTHKVIAPVDFYVDSSWLDGSRYYGPIPPDFGDKQ